MEFCFAYKIAFSTPLHHNGFDHFLARCLWQKDVIRAHAKCQTHIAYSDFFPVHTELLKDGILFCLQNCIFQLPSHRLEAAFGSNNIWMADNYRGDSGGNKRKMQG